MLAPRRMDSVSEKDFVTPAKAGVQGDHTPLAQDSRLRGNHVQFDGGQKLDRAARFQVFGAVQKYR